MTMRLFTMTSFIGAMCASSKAAVIHVPADHPTIQAAIDASVNGDTVIVAPGTYNQAINFNGKNITIESSGGPDVTTLFTNLSTSVVKIPNGPCTLRGFKITGGDGTPPNGDTTTRLGGGLYITGPDVLLADNIITANTANGGIQFTAGRGGGVYFNKTGGSLTLQNCTITNNTTSGGCGAGQGGGIYFQGGTLKMFDCTITGNQAIGTACSGMGAGLGGGVYAWNGTLVALNCNFDDNESKGAHAGGAGLEFSHLLTQVTLINCRITRNNNHNCCAGVGGAVSSGIETASPLTVHQCTIASNTMTGINQSSAAGGIYNLQGPEITVSNSIVFDNALAEIASNANVQNSCIEGGYAGTGNIDANPMFIDAANGDFRLALGSPAIDVGNLAQLPGDTFDLDGDGDTKELLPIDLAGERRVVNGDVDMGAYEWQRTCLGDISPSSPGVAGDGEINVDDLLAVINGWGECDICVADVNGDNSVNVDDLLAIINGWGTCK